MCVNRRQMSDQFTREKKCFGHYFQRGFWQTRSWNCDGASAGYRPHAAFGKIPVPSCVSIAIPPGLQTIAFHSPSSFKEEKCL